MTVHQLTARPPAALAASLAHFESQFRYPMGPGSWFRISHGEDYLRFFSAIGQARCFVAENKGIVLGTVSVALQKLRLPDGGELTAAYFADLKIAPTAYKGRILLQLFAAAKSWATTNAMAAYGIVMDGTPITPPRYTGRFEVPPFATLSTQAILRLGQDETPDEGEQPAHATSEIVEKCFRLLSHQQCTPLGGNPLARSLSPPQPLALPDGSACGYLEDTRRAKRLIADDGQELVSAHLSRFAYRDASSAAVLFKKALSLANQIGLPALFACVAPSDVAEIQDNLPGIQVVVAPATIYGFGLPSGMNWNINTAEI